MYFGREYSLRNLLPVCDLWCLIENTLFINHFLLCQLIISFLSSLFCMCPT